MTKLRLKSHLPLIGLLLFSLMIRLAYVSDFSIPFTFDHGKDSLAAMHMLLARDVKLIGPWTSIPGLYFGPAWYYLLGIGFLATNFNPMGGVYVMIFITLIETVLLYKYISKSAAVLSVTTPFWLMLSQSAWNPFPMTLLTLVIFILLINYPHKPSHSWRYALGLGLAASFGFHFSSAFAIFYPPIIFSFLLMRKLPIKLKSILSWGVGFGLPFLPQLLFELKHNFVQSRAVIDYFTQPGKETEVGRIGQVNQELFGLVKSSALPDFALLQNPLFLFVLGGLMLFWLIKQRHNPKKRPIIWLSIIFCIFPLIGFQFLHFNVWYLYALGPIFTILAGLAIDQINPRQLKAGLLVIFLASALFAVTRFQSTDKFAHAQHRVFLPIKLDTIAKIRELAGSDPYVVYTFVPHIYDYSYQYIYFWQASNGLDLPVEFSYSPGEISYVQQKPELLQLMQNRIQSGPPELIFLIIEQENNTLDQWWYSQWQGKLPPYEEIERFDLGDIIIIMSKPQAEAAS